MQKPSLAMSTHRTFETCRQHRARSEFECKDGRQSALNRGTTWINMRFEELPNEEGNDTCHILFFGIPDDCFREDPHTKVATPHDVRKIPPSIDIPKSGFVTRQDLFDRNNPNNLRSDWPGPPA